MIIAAIIAAGFGVLLVAPTLHRRSNARSREQALRTRHSRAEAILKSSTGSSRGFTRSADAARVRDHLLLHGVRAELLPRSGETLIVFAAEHGDAVDAAIDELGID